MASVVYTNTSGYTTELTHIELDSILGNLQVSNNYFYIGQRNLAYIKISSSILLLLDLDFNYTLKLFELFTFSYASENVYNLKLINNETSLEYDINAALLNIGYSKTLPIPNLDTIFLKTYTNTNMQTYIQNSNIVKNNGVFGSTAASIKTFTALGNIVLSNDANNFNIGTSFNINEYYSIVDTELLLTEYFTKDEITNLYYSKLNIDSILVSYYTQLQVYNLVNLKRNISDSYTKTEVNNLITNSSSFKLPMDFRNTSNLSKIYFDNTGSAVFQGDLTCNASLYGVSVYSGGYVCHTTNTAYSKTESDALLNAKQNTLSALGANKVLISDASGNIAVSGVSNTTLGYLDATSSIQTQLGTKQATITGSGTTVVTTNLSASRAVITNTSSKLAASTVTTTALGFLDASSSIQTQLDDRYNKSSMDIFLNAKQGVVSPSLNNDLNTSPYFRQIYVETPIPRIKGLEITSTYASMTSDAQAVKVVIPSDNTKQNLLTNKGTTGTTLLINNTELKRINAISPVVITPVLGIDSNADNISLALSISDLYNIFINSQGYPMYWCAGRITVTSSVASVATQRGKVSITNSNWISLGVVELLFSASHPDGVNMIVFTHPYYNSTNRLITSVQESTQTASSIRVVCKNSSTTSTLIDANFTFYILL